MSTYNICFANKAVTQFTGFDFNSYGVLNGVPVGASEDGLFALCEDSDDGLDIDGFFETPVIDITEFRNKSIRFFYLAFESDGELIVSASVDEGEFKDFAVIPKKTGRQNIRVPGKRKQYGDKWQFRIANKDGVWFAIDNFSILVNNRAEGIT